MFSLNMVNYPMLSLLLSTWIFLAEQVIHVYSLEFFLFEASFMLKCWGWVGWWPIRFLETAQSPNSPLPFLAPTRSLGSSSVCPSMTFMNSSLNPHASSLNLRADLEQS